MVFFQKELKNTGNAQIQVMYLSQKIQKMAKHFQQHKKDKHSKIGLLRSVNLRKKLIRYLSRKINLKI